MSVNVAGKSLEIDLPIGLSRYMPASALADTARAYEASGVIDSVSVWDQITWFAPRSLWAAESTGMIDVMADIDSFPDPFAALAYASCAAPGLGLAVATDAVRRSPGDLAQTMLTLNNMSKGQVTLQLGAGEVKQTQPFGWKRKEGLARMEDHLRAVPALLEADGPIDFEGNHWRFDQAWIGNGAKGERPRIWGLGGGPKLLDLTTSYADGFSTACRCVAHSPERWAEMVSDLKAQLVEKDRDPDAFDFALFPICCLIHEDEDVIDRALDNDLLRWITAVMGRINQSDWETDGITPPWPDWHYAMKLLPAKLGAAEAEEVLGRVTREMCEQFYIYGTPAQVAAEIKTYVDEGATWAHLADCLMFISEPEDAMLAPGRLIETAGILKELVGHAGSSLGGRARQG